LAVENEDLAEVLYQIYADPESVSGSDLDRAQHWMIMHYDNFRRTVLAYDAGLITEDVYQAQRVGLGYVYSSNIGIELIDTMRASALGDKVWEALSESAEAARAYCLSSKNKCLARYEAATADKS
ncbi:MAG: hypothetical protein V7742_23035, partial [Halioglobus sp.]